MSLMALVLDPSCPMGPPHALPCPPHALRMPSRASPCLLMPSRALPMPPRASPCLPIPSHVPLRVPPHVPPHTLAFRGALGLHLHNLRVGLRLGLDEDFLLMKNSLLELGKIWAKYGTIRCASLHLVWRISLRVRGMMHVFPTSMPPECENLCGVAWWTRTHHGVLCGGHEIIPCRRATRK